MKIKIVAFLVFASFAVMAAPAFSQGYCGATTKPAAKSTTAKPSKKATCPMVGDSKGSQMKAGDACPMTFGKGTKAKAPAKKVVSAVCPIMHNKIPDVTKAAGKSVYKGKTYYFCCPACKPLFDKNPGKYIKKK